MDDYLSMTRCPNFLGEKPCAGGLLPRPPEDEDKDDFVLGCQECGTTISREEHLGNVQKAISEYMEQMLSSMGGIAAISSAPKDVQYEQSLESIKHLLKYLPPYHMTPTSLLTALLDNSWYPLFFVTFGSIL